MNIDMKIGVAAGQFGALAEPIYEKLAHEWARTGIPESEDIAKMAAKLIQDALSYTAGHNETCRTGTGGIMVQTEIHEDGMVSADIRYETTLSFLFTTHDELSNWWGADQNHLESRGVEIV